MRRLFNALRYGAIFLKAFLKSNVDVAKRVLAPTLTIRPGFVEIPMEATSDFEVTMLANSVTLTPGTITVHVDRDRGTILIHALDVGDDPEAVRRDVCETLEANILNWTRPQSGRAAR